MAHYSYTVKREVTRLEVLDVEIIADDPDEADAIATAVGNGEPFEWPSVNRYSVGDIEPKKSKTLEIARVK